MAKRLVGLSLSTALALVLQGSAGAQEGEVSIYNWSDYVGETTLDDFTTATGIEVIYDVYDNNEIVEAKLLAGSSGYDLVVPTSQPFLARLVKAGAFMPLDRSKIPNWPNLDPALMAQLATADPDNAHAAIWQWGTTGMGYNPAAIAERMPDAPVDSYDLVFVPENAAKFADCGIAMLDSSTDIIPIALNYLGLDPNSEAEADLAAAEALLLSIRPHIRYFHSSQYINDLANGDICIAIGFSGDIVQASMRAEEAAAGTEVAYSIPTEGTLLWFDAMAIPADAPNPDAAHAFINFVLQPEVMAGITNYVAYANAVPASWPLVDPEIVNDPTIFPPPEVMAKLFAAREATPEFERLRTRSWTRIRTGQ